MVDRLGPYLLGPNDTPENGIYTGDARELAKAVPDESVDLIFTDPVYQNIDDYRWLAETAARVLKPNGTCLVWSNGSWHHKNTLWLEESGLCYRWAFAHMWHTGARLVGKIIAKTNRLLWFDLCGTSKMCGYLVDGYFTKPWSRIGGHNHKWTKDARYSSHAIEGFPSEVVFDPFTGGGTVPAVCKQLGRRYLAFEIDPDVAETARERVRNTQMPLFVLEPEQMTLGGD